MERGGEGERSDEFVGAGEREGHVSRTLISSQIAVAFAPRAGAFDAFGPLFITLDATHCLSVSGHIFEGLVTMGFSLLRGGC